MAEHGSLRDPARANDRGGSHIREARLPLDEASSVQSGKAFNFAVAVAGECGVGQAIGMRTSVIDRTLALIGRPTLGDLDRTAVNLRRAASVSIPSR